MSLMVNLTVFEEIQKSNKYFRFQQKKIGRIDKHDDENITTVYYEKMKNL